MDHRLALAQLQALANVPGALRVITGEVRPELRVDATDPRSPVKPDLAALDPDILKRPRAFIWHDVVRVEVDDRGRVTARTAEGDYTAGEPVAVLARLLEANAAGG